MRIGIDIDDTITNTYDLVIEEVAKELNVQFKELREKNYNYDDLYKGCGFPPMSQKIFDVFANLVSKIELKDDSQEYLRKLHNEGHEIIFITARSHTRPGQNEEYLKKHDIKYSKLIEGAETKEKFAREEQIELFIDDSVKNCKEIKNVGIDVILFDAPYNKKCEDLRRVSSWKEIYEYINNKK